MEEEEEENLLAGETAYEDGETRQLADIIDDWPRKKTLRLGVTLFNNARFAENSTCHRILQRNRCVQKSDLLGCAHSPSQEVSISHSVAAVFQKL